jgi:DNA-binding CsgD family transcriptional regulator
MKPLKTFPPAQVLSAPARTSVEDEREILRQLAADRRGALVLWDPGLRLAWTSPQAEGFVNAEPVRDELSRAAAKALRQVRPSSGVPFGCFDLGRARVPRSAGKAQFIVKFFSVRTPSAGIWLLAELKSCHEHAHRIDNLSAAERRVLRLLMAGLSNREIGLELFVSQETAKTHVSRVLHKLGVTSRAKAATLGREAGFDLENAEALEPAAGDGPQVERETT